ncbi:tetratricopeptide repeat protein [Winogradskyella sp. PE311]|uniref:tetratricopeptide repeat protein n=1 Tax=Winogradskyella sp. PE311 TaxID=3366943 RepID=UPI003980D17E
MTHQSITIVHMEEQKNRKKKWINTLKFFAAYLVAAWTFLQFVDWVLNRYNISPHWVDILLWFFIGISPSLIIFIYNQERLSKRIVKLREKIFIPLNVIILFIALYFGFGNSDLGATTKNIAFENEQGQLETKTITKEEFRVGVPIYGFKQVKEDSTTSWLRYGIGRLLEEDLLQNKNITPNFDFLTNTTTKIREASLFNTFYVDGTYDKVGSEYTITTYIRKASNGKILKEQTLTGSNILTLLDDISVFITSNSGFVEGNSLTYLDLPINEFISNSLPALEAYANMDYRKAYDIDKGFALAYLQEAKRNTLYNRGKLETQDIIDKAVALKNNLPLQKQLEVYIQRNLAYDNYEEAEKQVKLQLEVDPTNSFYNMILFSIYGETKNTKGYMTAAEDLFNKNPNGENGLNLSEAAMLNGNDDRIIDALKAYEIINPEIKVLKLEPLIFKGEIDKAKAIFKEYKLGNTKNTNRIKPYDSIFSHLESNPYNSEDLKQFSGFYRSENNEQTLEMWIYNGRLIQYVKNQSMRTFLPAGKDAIGGGFIQSQTFYNKLIKDKMGKTVGFRNHQFNWNNTGVRFYWKLDASILAADEAYQKEDLKVADSLYKIAFKNNPNHSYLSNLSKHIQYKQDNTSDVILLQNKNFSGDYGPRKFWIEDGKFYYKRKGENSDLVKVELLPISENLYMDLTRLGTMMEFTMDSSGKMASKAYSYITSGELPFKWEFVDNETVKNYFLKDD